MGANIDAAIEARALAFAGLTALIGTNPVRLYPLEAAQKAILPYVTYQVITDPPWHTMGADKDAQARVQFDVWASSWAIAKQVRDQVLACFDRLAPGTYGGTVLDGSICENRGSQLEPDDTSRLPRLTMEFEMTYRLP